MASIKNQNVLLGCSLLAAVGFGMLANKFKAGIKRLGTAFIGSFIVIRGIASYAGGLPSEFAESKEEAAALKRKGGNKRWANNSEEQAAIDAASQAILDRSKLEAESFAKVESAIKGATDSAQKFTNSFIISTKADGLAAVSTQRV